MLKKRIPTILGIILLLIGITAGVYLVELGPQPFTTRAGPEATPRDVKVTNITDASFSVSWQTEASAIGFVEYSTNPGSLNLSALDDRDEQNGNDREYTNHHVTVTGLTSETIYYFEIISGTESSTFDDEGKPYSVTTAPALEISAAADTSYGSIYYPDLTPVDGALVYVTINEASTLSSYSGSSGTWAVPLSSIRTRDLLNYFNYDKESTSLSIEVVAPDGNRSNAITTTARDTPVDDIVIGKSYDFSQEIIQGEIEEQTADSQFSTEAFDGVVDVVTESVTLDNISEGESVNSQNPEFIGSGPPGTAIEVILESEDPIQANLVVNDDGSWSWVPSSSLDPGEHKLTLRWVDENGIAQALTRSFVVLAQGDSDIPAFESTPSATPTSLPIPTITISPDPTSIPTPTTVASPSATPTTPVSPTTTPTTATDPSLPTPGTGFLSIMLVIGGLMITVLGSAILFVRRSS